MMAARVGQEPVSRPLRRDAELNLERILVAAQDVFAEGGYEAPMERIAQRAGVGVGTLYRRFPNKESLVVAIMEMAGQRSSELVFEVLEHSTPAEGIFEFLRRCVGLPASLRALVSRSPHLAETRDVVTAVLAARDDTQLLDAPAVLPEVPNLRCPDPHGAFAQFWPHRHGTDAIFLALLRRTA